MDRGIETVIQAAEQSLRRFDGAIVELDSHVVVFSFCNVKSLLRCCWHLIFPPVDDEMEREWMGREEVPPPVVIEVQAPGEPNSEERRHHGPTHLPYQSWCNVCVRARGRENRHESRSQVQSGTPVI